MTTIAELQTMLDTLEADLPQLIADHPDPADFWPLFAGRADAIEDQATDHCALVVDRINAMLAKHGRYIAVVDREPKHSDG